MTDPRAKLLSVTIISIGVLSPTSLLYVFVAASGLFIWSFDPRFSVVWFFRRVRKGAWFLGAILLIDILTENGVVLFQVAGLYGTKEGILAGIEQSGRIIIIIWGASLFVGTTLLEEMTDAAERWTVKKGRPLLAVATIALNYLPVLVENARKIQAVRLARGEPDPRGLIAGIRAAGATALPLFASALRSSDALAEAMESRCYRPSSRRTPFREITMPVHELVIILIVAAATGAALLRTI